MSNFINVMTRLSVQHGKPWKDLINLDIQEFVNLNYDQFYRHHISSLFLWVFESSLELTVLKNILSKPWYKGLDILSWKDFYRF